MAKFCSFKEASNTGWYLLLGWEVGKSSFVQNWPLQCCSAGRSGKPCNSLSTHRRDLRLHIIMVLTSLQEFNRERKEGINASKNAIASVSFSFFFFLARSSCFHSPQTPVPQAIMARIYTRRYERGTSTKSGRFSLSESCFAQMLEQTESIRVNTLSRNIQIW